MTPEALDEHLEPFTQALVALTEGRSNEVRLVAETAEIVAEGGAGWLALELIGGPGDRSEPNDFQVTLLLATGFEPDDEIPDPAIFSLILELDAGETWDEQSLRDTAALALGTLYYVYGLTNPAAYTLSSA